MKNNEGYIVCPKCGSSEYIYHYWAEPQYSRVAGYYKDTGNLNDDFEDSTDSKFMEKLFEQLGVPYKLPEAVLTHEPENGDVCCVWSAPSRHQLQDPTWKMAEKIRNSLEGFLTKEQSYEIASKYSQDPERDMVQIVMKKYMDDAAERPKRQQLASIIAEMLKTSEANAMKIVERYYSKGLDKEFGDDPKAIVINYMSK